MQYQPKKHTTIKLGFTEVKFIQSGRVFHELAYLLGGVFYYNGVYFHSMVNATGPQDEADQGAEVAGARAYIQERQPRLQLKSLHHFTEAIIRKMYNLYMTNI